MVGSAGQQHLPSEAPPELYLSCIFVLKLHNFTKIKCFTFEEFVLLILLDC